MKEETARSVCPQAGPEQQLLITQEKGKSCTCSVSTGSTVALKLLQHLDNMPQQQNVPAKVHAVSDRRQLGEKEWPMVTMSAKALAHK